MGMTTLMRPDPLSEELNSTGCWTILVVRWLA